MSIQLMGVLNLTPDSFWSQSRTDALNILSRIEQMKDRGMDYVDIGAVSTRPGAPQVSLEQEWNRLEPALKILSAHLDSLPRLSIDTTRSEIVRRCYSYLGEFIVNDISAGEDDKDMLGVVSELKLRYIAMHKRGNPANMDSLSYYKNGVMPELLEYFNSFSDLAQSYGISDWILDPGLGFAKSNEQNWEILSSLESLKIFGRPILIGASDKRFTSGDNKRAEQLAIEHGADILRVH